MRFIDPAPAHRIYELFYFLKPQRFSLHAGITPFHNKKLLARGDSRNFGITD